MNDIFHATRVSLRKFSFHGATENVPPGPGKPQPPERPPMPGHDPVKDPPRPDSPPAVPPQEPPPGMSSRDLVMRREFNPPPARGKGV
jgi:hypothetical protein